MCPRSEKRRDKEVGRRGPGRGVQTDSSHVAVRQDGPCQGSLFGRLFGTRRRRGQRKSLKTITEGSGGGGCRRIEVTKEDLGTSRCTSLREVVSLLESRVSGSPSVDDRSRTREQRSRGSPVWSPGSRGLGSWVLRLVSSPPSPTETRNTVTVTQLSSSFRNRKRVVFSV